MTDYILAFHGGHKFETPEEGAKHMAKWQSWVAQTGEAMKDPGKPLGMSKTVSKESVKDGGGANPVVGIVIVSADSMDGAVEIAKKCPHLNIGTIEVAEVMVMPGAQK